MHIQLERVPLPPVPLDCPIPRKQPFSFLLFPWPQWWVSPRLKMPADRMEDLKQARKRDEQMATMIRARQAADAKRQPQ